MPFLYTMLLGISFLGLLILSFFDFKSTRNRGALLLRLITIATALTVIVSVFGFRNLISKGGQDLAFALVLYLCMLGGMLASYAHQRFTLPQEKRPSFDMGQFFAPVFASPIIFIPLLGALQNADIDVANLNSVKLMVFLVAFENGFFWKEYYDKRQAEAGKK